MTTPRLRSQRSRHHRSRYLLEAVESRTLFSASYATLVMEAPRLPALPVQADHNAPQSQANTGAFDSALDIQVRTTAAGIYLTVAASSVDLMALAPTGTISLYDESQFLGAVALGGAVRTTLVLPAGPHTFFATYLGDTNFKVSQTSISADLRFATSTLPANPADANTYATNSSGERIRASRFLSTINFFDAQGLTVSAIPPTPLLLGSGGTDPSFTLAPSNPIPTPRFSKITFSLKLPKVIGT